MSETTIRLFVSSPADVAAERRRVALIVQRLNGEFAGRARIEPVFWEDSVYSAHDTFQNQIDDPAHCDIVIAVLGTRLGTRLPDDFPRHPRTGQPYPSGTAYEILTAIESRKDGQPLPDIYVFRQPNAPSLPIDSPKRTEAEAQWAALQNFFQTWFQDPSGSFIAAFNPYGDTDDFARQAETCLRDFLQRRGLTTDRAKWDRIAKGSPFPGLEAFQADRRAVFFGRDRATGRAIAQLRHLSADPSRLPFLLVIGASGSGKSSLLRAGIVPVLTTPGTIPDVDLWFAATVTADGDPFLGLAKALFDVLGEPLRQGAFATPALLARQLAAEPDLALAPLRAALTAAARAHGAPAGFAGLPVAKLAVSLDQAERLFTEAAPATAAGFAALLLGLADSGLAHVAIVLRGDAYARFQGVAPLLTLRERGATLDLVPPDATELESIVLGPVATCEPALAFEDGLAARLATDAAGGDALPLLQVALARLYEAQDRRGDGVLRAADYPGMAEAVSQTAEAAMVGLPDAPLEPLVAALVSDVTPDLVATIAPLHRPTFETGHPERAGLLDAFIDARLLTASGDTVRPTHEALLRIWPRAVALVKELGPLLRARHMLEPLAREWDAAAEAVKAGHLDIAPATLSAALQLRGRLDVTPVLTAFIAACAAAAEARRRRETSAQRRRVAALSGGLVVALGLAGLAGWQWRDASRQRDKAEQALTSATEAANTMVFGLAQKFSDNGRIPVDVARDILDQATKLQERLNALGPPNPALRRSQATALSQKVNTLLAQGLTLDALAAARQSRDIMQSLADAEPANTDWQRELSVSLNKLGDVLTEQGNLPEALQSYRASRDIFERLAKSDPGNAGWQYDLGTSNERIGDVLMAQGNLPEALQSYRARHDIVERLAKSDPGNAGWQRDLSVSWNKLGDVLVAQGTLPEALQSYRAGLAITERLAKSDPGNAGWQRDLSVSLEKLGNVLVAQGNLAEALQSYRDSRDIADRLAKFDPGNAGWQRDLSVSLEKLGDVLVAQGNLAEALQSFGDSRDIRERLAKSDPGNAGWQRDLSLSYAHIATASLEAGQTAKARAALTAGRQIVVQLLAQHPDHPQWKQDLAWFDSNISGIGK